MATVQPTSDREDLDEAHCWQRTTPPGGKAAHRSTAAGEDIRIVPVTDTWPLDVPDKDFWLFNSQQLFDLNYDADGNWLGVQHNTDPAAVARAGFVRDAALHQSTSWADYVATKSALLQRLPKGE
jgi:hypothetical protein